jgi:hypothetical protein
VEKEIKAKEDAVAEAEAAAKKVCVLGVLFFLFVLICERRLLRLDACLVLARRCPYPLLFSSPRPPCPSFVPARYIFPPTLSLLPSP